jgi:hypothetical protein
MTPYAKLKIYVPKYSVLADLSNSYILFKATTLILSARYVVG